MLCVPGQPMLVYVEPEELDRLKDRRLPRVSTDALGRRRRVAPWTCFSESTWAPGAPRASWWTRRGGAGLGDHLPRDESAAPRLGRGRRRGTWWREVCEISGRLAGDAAGVEARRDLRERRRPCLVLCDADLTPLRPAILYGIDTRATAEIVR